MSLQEFKQANKGHPVWINTGDPSRKLNKKLSRQVDTPLCTDTTDGFEGSNTGYRRPGEVICNISPGIWNPDARVIGDIQLNQVLYRFYAGKLYSVSLTFATIKYLSVRSAFVAKFGPPSATAKVDCQNAFGARWTAESANWTIGPSKGVTLLEGCGNGPGQNAFDDISSGSITDSSLEPPRPTQRAADF